MNKVAARTYFVALCGLCAALTSGCKQQGLCSELDSCGGSMPPFGNWVLAPGNPSCTEDLYVPAADTRLVVGDVPSTGKPLPEPALFDWCVLLVTGPRISPDILVVPPRFYYESSLIGNAFVRYNADLSFSAGLTNTGTFTLDFPEFCVRAFGATDGRQADPANDPMGPPVGVCKQLEVPLAASGLGEGSYPNARCEPNPADPGGCLCKFDVTETGGPTGSFRQVDGNTLLHISGKGFPNEATFCHQGDRLQLTAKNGAYLFDRRGVRTFDLIRACQADTDCNSGFCAIPMDQFEGICRPRP